MAASDTLSLEQCIQKWLLVDNQLQLLQEKTKTMREWKKKLTEKIIEKGMENKIVSISDSELSLQDKKEYSSLSFGFIETCLNDIITDSEKVEYIMDYLREHREIKTVKEIRRKNILSNK
jgi:iron only hydrogenase large subunit-like protein